MHWTDAKGACRKEKAACFVKGQPDVTASQDSGRVLNRAITQNHHAQKGKSLDFEEPNNGQACLQKAGRACPRVGQKRTSSKSCGEKEVEVEGK